MSTLPLLAIDPEPVQPVRCRRCHRVCRHGTTDGLGPECAVIEGVVPPRRYRFSAVSGAADQPLFEINEGEMMPEPDTDPRSEAARRESAIQTLISQRDQAIDDLKATRGQLATMTEVARGNKRHVTYLVEENEALRAELARVRADVAEEIGRALAERDQARADLATVQGAILRIHARDDERGPDGHDLYGCIGCDDGETWPCPTVRALRPDASAESVVAAPPDVVGTPVVDEHGNLLWLHVTCGMTQWLSPAAEPSYCGACCVRTQAWVQMHRAPAAVGTAGGGQPNASDLDHLQEARDAD